MTMLLSQLLKISLNDLFSSENSKCILICKSYKMQKLIVLSSVTFALTVAVFFCVFRIVSTNESLEGNTIKCETEGLRIQNIYCYECFCQNKIPRCWKSECYKNCSLIKNEASRQSCCEGCKGCLINNVYRESNLEWIDENNSCKILKCNNGMVNESSIECSSCNDKKTITEKCCSSCVDGKRNSFYNDENFKKITNLHDAAHEYDKTKFDFKNDLPMQYCQNVRCPILECDLKFQEKNPEDCCSRCKSESSEKIMSPDSLNLDSTKKYNLHDNDKKNIKVELKNCVYNNLTFQHGETWVRDKCQNCSCDQGKINCPPSCPVPKCSDFVVEIIIPEGECCYKCVEPHEYFKKGLRVNFTNVSSLINKIAHEKYGQDHTLNIIHEKEKKVNLTTEFEKKKEGKNYHEAEKRKNNQYEYDEFETESESEYDEAKESEEADNGTCKVSGGSYFQTFDNNIYAISGSCDYTLVSDCDRKTFEIQLTIASSNTNVMMKKVSIIYENKNVELHKKQVILDDRIIKLPYMSKDKLKITKKNADIVTLLENGIQISWNYIMGLLEVTVTKNFRKKLCGLCGNFDYKASNDLITREGILVEDPSIFAQSWSAGDEICYNTRNYKVKSYDTSFYKRICSYMKGSFFEACDKKLRVKSYYEQCLEEMYECTSSDKKCYCKSFEKYVSDCNKLGVHLPRWKKSVGC